MTSLLITASRIQSISPLWLFQCVAIWWNERCHWHLRSHKHLSLLGLLGSRITNVTWHEASVCGERRRQGHCDQKGWPMLFVTADKTANVICEGIPSPAYFQLCIEPDSSAFSRLRVKFKNPPPFTMNLKQTCRSIFLWVDWHFSLCFISRIWVIRQPLHVVHPPGLLSRPKAQSSL